MIFLLLISILITLIILALSFNIHRWLWSNSVFTWCRARFLRTCSLFSTHSNDIATSRHIATHQVVVLWNQTKWVRRRTSMTIMMNSIFRYNSINTLSVGTCRSFLSGSRPQTLTVRALTRSKTSLTSLVLLSGLLLTWPRFSTCYNLSTLTLHTSQPLERIHFILKSCGSHGSTRFEDSQLLLVKYLTVCKSLILLLAKMRWSHYLLRHHKIILLRSIHAFRALHALDASHPEGGSWPAYSTDITDSTRCVLIYASWPILIFIWNLWTISF